MNLIAVLHKHLGWTVFVFLTIAVIWAIYKWKGNKSYGRFDMILYLITSSLVEFQVLMGIILYVAKQKWKGFSEMDVDVSRFFAIEHLLGMLIVVALVSIGRGRSKRSQEPVKKHRYIAIWFGIALALVLLSFPWPFRF